MHLYAPALAASAAVSTLLATGHTLRAKLIGATGRWMSNPATVGTDGRPLEPALAEERVAREQKIRRQLRASRLKAIGWWVAAAGFTLGAWVVARQG